jgi:uncharacterized protein YbjT (DUF2867 family)
MSDGSQGLVLVTGATGNQGGAVAQALLEAGRPVRALTRSPDSPAAAALTEAGAEVVQGDLEDRASLDRALEGVAAVFSVQNVWEHGDEAEVRQGKAFADAAADHGVEHFVYSSVGGAERDSGVPHFESKWEIEQHIRGLGLPATILRPVFLMENFRQPQYRATLNGVFPIALDPEKPVQMIACADVGRFSALAFEHPDEWIGRELEIAGEERTPPQMAEAFAAVLGHPVRHVRPPMEMLRNVNPEVAHMYEWYDAHGFAADMQEIGGLLPDRMSLESWLRSTGWVEQAQDAPDAGPPGSLGSNA